MIIIIKKLSTLIDKSFDMEFVKQVKETIEVLEISEKSKFDGRIIIFA